MRRHTPAIVRHPPQLTEDGVGCEACPAPVANTRYHPDVTWLQDNAHHDTVHAALAAALETRDPFILQAQLEVVLQLLARRYRRVCSLDPAGLWPGLGLNRRAAIAAADSAIAHLCRTGALERALDFHRRPITITRNIRGRARTARLYLPTHKGAPR